MNVANSKTQTMNLLIQISVTDNTGNIHRVSVRPSKYEQFSRQSSPSFVQKVTNSCSLVNGAVVHINTGRGTINQFLTTPHWS